MPYVFDNKAHVRELTDRELREYRQSAARVFRGDAQAEIDRRAAENPKKWAGQPYAPTPQRREWVGIDVQAVQRDEREQAAWLFDVVKKREEAAWWSDVVTRLSAAVDKMDPDDLRLPKMHGRVADSAQRAADACAALGNAKGAQKFSAMAQRHANAAEEIEPPTLRKPRRSDDEEPITQRRPVRRRGEAGFARLEPLYLVAGGAVGFAAAPRLNARITVRPLGRYVPPSAVATVAVLLGAGLARRHGLRNTAVASFGLGLGLGLGTLASARNDGGLLAGKGL